MSSQDYYIVIMLFILLALIILSFAIIRQNINSIHERIENFFVGYIGIEQETTKNKLSIATYLCGECAFFLSTEKCAFKQSENCYQQACKEKFVYLQSECGSDIAAAIYRITHP